MGYRIQIDTETSRDTQPSHTLRIEIKNICIHVGKCTFIYKQNSIVGRFFGEEQ